MPDCWRIILRACPEVDDAQALEPDWIFARLVEVMLHIERMPGVVMKDIYAVVARRHALSRRARPARRRQCARHQPRGGMNMNCGMHAYARSRARSRNPGDARWWKTPRTSDGAWPSTLIPRTDRNVAGGTDWLDHARDRERSRQGRRSLRTTAMFDGARAVSTGGATQDDAQIMTRRVAGVPVPPSNPSVELRARGAARRPHDAVRVALSVMPGTTLEERNRRYAELYRDSVKAFGELQLRGVAIGLYRHPTALRP